jgi:predicted PurR-regulated permease PerM
MDKISGTLVRQAMLLLLIALVATTLFSELYWLAPAVMTAYTLYILLRHPLEILARRWKWPLKIAAVSLMLTSLLMLGGAVHLIVRMLGNKMTFLRESPEKWMRSIESLIRDLEGKYGIELLTPDNLNSLTARSITEAQRLFNATLNGLAIVALGYFILFFMLTHTRALEQGFRDWLPLKSDNATYFRKQLDMLVFSNALGIPLMGFVQGLAGLVMYWLLGIPDAGLWFVLTCITGMLPFLGVALVYVPLSLILLAQNNVWSALIILGYGFVVIGSVDNLARMWLMEKIGHTHPLVTLFGVIAGIPLFGFIGLIFGPILVSLFLILVKLYVKEFKTEVKA